MHFNFIVWKWTTEKSNNFAAMIYCNLALVKGKMFTLFCIPMPLLKAKYWTMSEGYWAIIDCVRNGRILLQAKIRSHMHTFKPCIPMPLLKALYWTQSVSRVLVNYPLCEKYNRILLWAKKECSQLNTLPNHAYQW